MDISRSLKLRDKAMSRIYDAYACAKIYHSTSAQLFEAEQTAMKTVAACPQWVKTYLQGARLVLFDQLWRNDLESCYELDDHLYSVRKDSVHRTIDALINAGQDHMLSGIECHAYWLGTGRRFS